MFSIGDGVADDVLKEDLKNTTSLLVDKAGDTLYTATTGETTDSGLGDTLREDYYQCAAAMRADRTLNVVTKNLAMAFSTPLSETLRTTKAHISTRLLKRVRTHTLPPFPRPDMSSLCCRSVVNFLECASCSTSDGGVDDGGKKRKPFVDQTSLITFVSRLFGRIDALLLRKSIMMNLFFQ